MKVMAWFVPRSCLLPRTAHIVTTTQHTSIQIAAVQQRGAPLFSASLILPTEAALALRSRRERWADGVQRLLIWPRAAGRRAARDDGRASSVRRATGLACGSKECATWQPGCLGFRALDRRAVAGGGHAHNKPGASPPHSARCCRGARDSILAATAIAALALALLLAPFARSTTSSTSGQCGRRRGGTNSGSGSGGNHTLRTVPCLSAFSCVSRLVWSAI